MIHRCFDELLIKHWQQFRSGFLQLLLKSPAALQTQTLPKCRNGTLEVARSSNFSLSDGSVVVVGKAATRQYEVTYPGRLAPLEMFAPMPVVLLGCVLVSDRLWDLRFNCQRS